jgi:hypothetical protein
MALDLTVRIVSINGSTVSRACLTSLHTSLDDVQRVHDQNLRHTGNGTSCELVHEGKRLGFGGHIDCRVGWSGEVVGSLSRCGGMNERMRVSLEWRVVVS